MPNLTSNAPLVGSNSDIPGLRNDRQSLNLTPFLFFTLNLRGRLQGIGNGFGACIFFSVRTAENASLGRRTSSPKPGGVNSHGYLPRSRTRLWSSPDRHC